MASFQQAVAKTELFEGGYSNNPYDAGGETYRGISRKNWPNWKGWALIDTLKAASAYDGGIAGILDASNMLQGLVLCFYQKNFWQYDGLNDQDVAWKVFDLSVNVGKVHAVKILQQAVGTNLDGVYGPNTERLANGYSTGTLTPILIASAEKYHELIVSDHPEDAEFLSGWLRRDSTV